MVIKLKGVSLIATRHLWIMKLGIVPRVRSDVKLFPVPPSKERTKERHNRMNFKQCTLRQTQLLSNFSVEKESLNEHIQR